MPAPTARSAAAQDFPLTEVSGSRAPPPARESFGCLVANQLHREALIVEQLVYRAQAVGSFGMIRASLVAEAVFVGDDVHTHGSISIENLQVSGPSPISHGSVANDLPAAVLLTAEHQ